MQLACSQARVAQLDAAIERVEPAIPLPPPPHEFDATAAQELEARQRSGGRWLPSCAFLTFVNTAQALNCAAFSPDGSSVAGAMRRPLWLAVSFVHMAVLTDSASGAHTSTSAAEHVVARLSARCHCVWS
jgi:hypothetical protein